MALKKREFTPESDNVDECGSCQTRVNKKLMSSKGVGVWK